MFIIFIILIRKIKYCVKNKNKKKLFMIMFYDYGFCEDLNCCCAASISANVGPLL